MAIQERQAIVHRPQAYSSYPQNQGKTDFKVARCPLAQEPLTKRAMHTYQIRAGNDKRGVDLISDALLFGRLWYGEPNAVSNAIGYAQFYSRSHDAVIRVYDNAGNVLETHEHKRDFKEP